MSLTEERWGDEEAWWTMGAAEARMNAHPACVMATPQGVVQGEAMLAALDAGPRWSEVTMTDRHATEGEDCVVLAYRATARQADGQERRAVCTSTWVRQQDGWRIVQHHQSAPDRADAPE